MHSTPLRVELGDGFDAAAVFSAILGDRDDVFWLDSGPGGVSYLGTGTPMRFDDDPIGNGLRDIRGGPHLGAVGWLGYELRGSTTGAEIPIASGFPDASFLAVDGAIAIDAATGSAELIGDAAHWRAPMLELAGVTAPAPARLPAAGPVRWRDSEAEYLAHIAACQAAIRDGEAYQLCLTTEVRVDGVFDPLQVFLRLRESSASHHGGLIRIGGVSLVSASPEQFLAVDRGGRVTTRPIKGTRPRSADPDEDARLAADLLHSEKERAENLMIVDLMRNDLARVCELGSVAVTGLLEVESYPQVHQLVSTVVGQLEAGRSPVDAIEACFPAGSMTGAPKRRATELLAAIEGRARGPYAGAFGYLGSGGQADLAMTIRTIVLDDSGATIGTGGGITALSVPEEELAEIKVKAAAPLAALGVPDSPPAS